MIATGASGWSGQSLQEIQSGSQMPMLLALSCILIFLCLAARSRLRGRQTSFRP